MGRTSSDNQRNEMLSAPPFQDRRSSDSTYCDETFEVDYVRRMDEMKLEQSDRPAQACAEDEFQNKVITSSLKNPMSPTTPTPTKKDDLNVICNESPMSENSKSLTPRPVRVSQFEDSGLSPSLSKSLMASSLSTKLASVTKKTTSLSWERTQMGGTLSLILD